MEKVKNCPATKDIEQLEKYIEQLNGFAKDIEETNKLPENFRGLLILYLTPLCGHKSRKYNTLYKQIDNLKEETTVAQNYLTGAQSIVSNHDYVCEQFVKIIDGLIKYTKRRISRLRKASNSKAR